MISNPPKILVVQSQISELKKVEEFIRDILEKYNLKQKYFNKIYLCVSEAVINSIKHGNKNDKRKKITVGVDCKNQVLVLNIEDEGDGFDINQLQNPTHTENLRSESGRGIFIIKNMSDKLEYNEKGNRIQFNIECK